MGIKFNIITNLNSQMKLNVLKERVLMFILCIILILLVYLLFVKKLMDYLYQEEEILIHLNIDRIFMEQGHQENGI